LLCNSTKELLSGPSSAPTSSGKNAEHRLLPGSPHADKNKIINKKSSLFINSSPTSPFLSSSFSPQSRSFSTTSTRSVGVGSSVTQASARSTVAFGGGAGYIKQGVVDPTVAALAKQALEQNPEARRQAVLDTVRDRVGHHKDAFYVVDVAEVAYKHAEWRSQLPRVRPFFAVKCNDDPEIVKTLADLGTGMDCATKGEISMALRLGVRPEDIIFAHPAKQPSHIQYAKSKGVAKMTFDNVDELVKIHKEHPGAECVLRILTDDSASVCRLGLKFGAPLTSVPTLLSKARELGVKVVGVSYHVGSGNGNADSFADAVRDARVAFDIASSMGFKFRLLDIGGGFPGSETGMDLSKEAELEANAQRAANQVPDDSNPYSKHPTFRAIARKVSLALDKYFPEGCGVDIIAEPGRFFVKSTHTLVVNVVGKRATADEGTIPMPVAADSKTRWNYYVNDGLYGSFNCVMYDHAVAYPNTVIKAKAIEQHKDTQPSLIAESEIDITAIGMRGGVKTTTSSSHSSSSQLSSSGVHPDSVAHVNSQGNVVVSDALGLEHAAHLASLLKSAVANNAARNSERSSQRSSMQMGMRGMHMSTSAPAASAFGPLYPTTLWGPTCDSIDKITDVAVLPELDVGDWLVFESMGAYTIAGSCRFNGFPLTTKVYRKLDGTIAVGQEEETA
jgi:ornithine decarboxylase